ncbi:hydroxyacid dehydrogenase [Haloarcula onubensis]|uniref:Hydroxyacid dehydrogenase n=1 Tax=Haloarcula onubensis TaxID=2950539 RepID=A0ABU2FIR5_9EURY|nr:hydroxyacid dehydrogenase [Halomicroarcula sp. S3CR25-11]MDS0280651.1 hydroxyacid dehydrogenase [Halomicroarcula sp. S3CR25-11]
MSETWEVLLPKEIDPSGPDSISDFANCTGMDEYDSYDDALADIARYDAVIVRVAPLSADVIDRADDLKVISKHGAGLDNVDVAAATERDIVVCNTPGANAQSVAEHAIASLFGLRRHLHTADRHVRAGEWDRAAFTGRELSTDTLGLYGFGDIAQKTAAMATGMGMRVVAYDPRKPDEYFPEEVQRAERFEGLFERADAVSIHVPLTEQTHHSISTAELRALGEHGVLVNTARGAVIDESALVEALDAGTVGGAALDTFESEPPGEDHPLFGRDDVLLTPHIGGVTTQALARMSRQAAANVRTVYEGGTPDSTRNAEGLSGADE